MSEAAERVVTVCAECFRASCWHGEWLCEESRHADLVDLPVSRLRELNREPAENYSTARVREVCGE